MKIKAVCEVTGLTDRTVRYYIEQELIFPAYTENYLGRRTFDFSQEDIDRLNDIAVLRKFGFSIAEIKLMLQDPQQIIPIVNELQNRKAVRISEEQALLSTLRRLDPKRLYTVPELVSVLSEPVAQSPLPTEDTKSDLTAAIVRLGKAVLTGLVMWFPVFISCLLLICEWRDYAYPKVNWTYVGFSLYALVPMAALVILPKIGAEGKWKKILRKVLLAVCVVGFPLRCIITTGIIQCSETTDFGDYRNLDAQCTANRSILYQEMFPAWPNYFDNVEQEDGSWETVYLDAHYYYHYFQGLDYTYDIFAQWPLEEEEFYEEVARVSALMEEYAPAPEDRTAYRNYVTVQKGSYTCLILYWTFGSGTPFEAVTDNYTYYVFAYDEENLIVRYIFCDSMENGADQPYYLSLDWGE